MSADSVQTRAPPRHLTDELARAQTSPKTSRACRVPVYPLPLESNSEKGPFVAQGYHFHASVPPSNPSLRENPLSPECSMSLGPP